MNRRDTRHPNQSLVILADPTSRLSEPTFARADSFARTRDPRPFSLSAGSRTDSGHPCTFPRDSFAIPSFPAPGDRIPDRAGERSRGAGMGGRSERAVEFRVARVFTQTVFCYRLFFYITFKRTGQHAVRAIRMYPNVRELNFSDNVNRRTPQSFLSQFSKRTRCSREERTKQMSNTRVRIRLDREREREREREYHRDISENPISLRFSSRCRPKGEGRRRETRQCGLLTRESTRWLARKIPQNGVAGSGRVNRRGRGIFRGGFRFSRVPCNNSLLNPRCPSVRPCGTTIRRL